MTAATAPRLDDEPPPPYDGMPVSEDDYWAWYYEGPEETYEWNNGVLEEKGVSDHLTFKVFDWFLLLLIEYLREHPLAERVGLETGFRLAMPGRTTIRRPDYALIRHDNPRPIDGLDRSYRGIYDLCIEGLSDSDRKQRDRDLIGKKAEYAAIGVREYYVLHHQPRYRAFWRLGAGGVYEPLPVDGDGVVTAALLPGFRWRLTDLDRRPPLTGLIDDPVYSDYVLTPLQQQRARADQAEQAQADARAQADRERARADAAARSAADERARAERLAARLRALGIEPD